MVEYFKYFVQTNLNGDEQITDCLSIKLAANYIIAFKEKHKQEPFVSCIYEKKFEANNNQPIQSILIFDSNKHTDNELLALYGKDVKETTELDYQGKKMSFYDYRGYAIHRDSDYAAENIRKILESEPNNFE